MWPKPTKSSSTQLNARLPPARRQLSLVGFRTRRRAQMRVAAQAAAMGNVRVGISLPANNFYLTISHIICTVVQYK
jgi:hypothetical protein